MSKGIQFAWAAPMILLVVGLIASLPILVQVNENQALQLHWSQAADSLWHYAAGIFSGESFQFQSQQSELSFWSQIGIYFRTSFFYMACGALLGTTIGVLAGIYFSLTRAGWLKQLVDMVGAIPDFISIMLLQFLIVYIAIKTGIVLFNVSSMSIDDTAVMLPLISAIIIPAGYMIRNVAMQMTYTLTEDYIGFAKAHGMGRMKIVFHYALPNVLPFIKADLPKFLGILMGNLFIIEYLYNLHGITMLLFSNSFGPNGYQYPLVMNGLLAMLVLYAVVYGLSKTYLWGWEKVLSR